MCLNLRSKITIVRNKMKVFKFGGASVKNADAVSNVATILQQYEGEKVLVVVSAMAKTTNLLEDIVKSYMFQSGHTQQLLQQLTGFHLELCRDLFMDDKHPVFNELENLFLELDCMLEKEVGKDDHDFIYDQIVSYGELISTKIISAYLLSRGIRNKWVDARNFIFTDNNHREAAIIWPETERIIVGKLKPFAEKSMVITQGFIGKNKDNATTTLGREGSDYSAAIFAWALDAESVTIWKDVAGVMNADPKRWEEATLIPHMSFNQAIELAYYGASVIHPKTIQPLKSKGIPLLVKSFNHPENKGTVVAEGEGNHSPKTCYIFKDQQCLITCKSRDFSFIAENNLQDIFRSLAYHKVRVNVMQNSAISFNAVVDDDPRKIEQLLQELTLHFVTEIKQHLKLITVYNPIQDLPDKLINSHKVLMEQRSERVLHLLVSG